MGFFIVAAGLPQRRLPHGTHIMAGQAWMNRGNTRGRGMQFKFDIVDDSPFAPAAAKDVPTQGGTQYEVQDEAAREHDGQQVQEQEPSSPAPSSSDAPIGSSNRSSSSSSSSSASLGNTSPSGDDGLDRVGLQEEAGIERSEVAEQDALPDGVGASSSGVHGGGGFAEFNFFLARVQVHTDLQGQAQDRLDRLRGHLLPS